MKAALRAFEYMAWAKTAPAGARIDLTASGVPDTISDDATADPEWMRSVDPRNWCRRATRDDAQAQFVQAVADRYGVSPDRVVPTSGASLAITHVLMAMLRPGDQVVVERPTYEALHRVPEIFGANVSRLERRFDERWAVVPDRLARLLTSRTRAVILSNLHNPSGVAIDRATLTAVTDLAARVGATVLVDEVYLDFTFAADAGASVVPACLVAPNAVSWSSATKAFGFGALRCGWIVTGTPDAARAIRLATHYLHVDAPVSTLQMGTYVVQNADSVLAASTARAAAGRAVLDAWIAQEPRVKWVAPQGGISGCLRLPDLMHDGQFADHLRSRYETQVVPGAFFEAPGFVRLSFGGDPEALREGLTNLSSALDDLSAVRAASAR